MYKSWEYFVFLQQTEENRPLAEEFVVDTDFNSECEINKRFLFHHRQTSDHTDRAAAYKLKYMNTTGTNQSQSWWATVNLTVHHLSAFYRNGGKMEAVWRRFKWSIISILTFFIDKQCGRSRLQVSKATADRSNQSERFTLCVNWKLDCFRTDG